MFRLAETLIDPAALAAELAALPSSPDAGALATFEGWVRRHNLARGVERLEYEACASLCEAEAARIIEEARAKFSILGALAVHRAGMLEIGDVAVWVGATAAHRDDAFRACRYLIDQIKRRLPIWKKEYYTGAAPGWIDPTENAGASALECVERDAPLDAAARARYARQMRLPGIGAEGQLRLARATALVVAAGGLGCPALQYLAAAGVGRIVICDGDLVETANLHRQILFDAADVGLPKAEVAAEKIRRLAPGVRIDAVAAMLDAGNAAQLISGANVVLDGSDNFATRFLVHDACRHYGVPLVHAAAHQFEGQIMVFDPDAGPGCLRCMYPATPEEGCAGDCASAGIFGPATGALGAWQAGEAIKILLGMTSELTRGTLMLDLADGRARFIARAADPHCPVCAPESNWKFDPENYRNADEGAINAEQWHAHAGESRRGQSKNSAARVMLDLRAPAERDEDPAWLGDLMRPLPPDPDALRALDAGAEYLLICSRGLVSARLAKTLRAEGRRNFHCLAGGLPALIRWRNAQ